MSAPEMNQKIPDCEVKATSDRNFKLYDLKGKIFVLYFYPKDNTPGCTTEGKEFTAHRSDFAALNAAIVGVSRDSVKKHDNFIAKQELDVILGADIEGTVTEDYGVWVEKSMYGKTYMGIERATFLIDGEGIVRRVWRKVSVKGHADEVLSAVRAL